LGIRWQKKVTDKRRTRLASTGRKASGRPRADITTKLISKNANGGHTRIGSKLVGKPIRVNIIQTGQQASIPPKKKLEKKIKKQEEWLRRRERTLIEDKMV
jgi:hypothetical protein